MLLTKTRKAMTSLIQTSGICVVEMRWNLEGEEKIRGKKM
jgi:hypothetical protein